MMGGVFMTRPSLVTNGVVLRSAGTWSVIPGDPPHYPRVWYTPVVGCVDLHEDAERVPKVTTTPNWVDLRP